MTTTNAEDRRALGATVRRCHTQRSCFHIAGRDRQRRVEVDRVLGEGERDFKRQNGQSPAAGFYGLR